MTGFTGFMVYFMVWWTALFAILPIGVKPETGATTGGWRGTPQSPGLLRKALWTTVVTTIIWVGIYTLVNSDWLSFREGWLAMPSD